MATDRDEQQRDQQRQAQELEEIRRSFAEMGARMGSLFEPAEAGEPERAQQAALSASSATPATPAPGVFQARPRWWWAGLLALLFVAGTAFGWLLPRGGDGRSWVRWVYLACIAIMFVTLIALVVLDWEGLDTTARVAFTALTGLAAVMMLRIVLAARGGSSREPGWEGRYIGHVYFTYISI